MSFSSESNEVRMKFVIQAIWDQVLEIFGVILTLLIVSASCYASIGTYKGVMLSSPIWYNAAIYYGCIFSCILSFLCVLVLFIAAIRWIYFYIKFSQLEKEYYLAKVNGDMREKRVIAETFSDFWYNFELQALSLIYWER
jgi:hypothetical protein